MRLGSLVTVTRSNIFTKPLCCLPKAARWSAGFCPCPSHQRGSLLWLSDLLPFPTSIPSLSKRGHSKQEAQPSHHNQGLGSWSESTYMILNYTVVVWVLDCNSAELRQTPSAWNAKSGNFSAWGAGCWGSLPQPISLWVFELCRGRLICAFTSQIIKSPPPNITNSTPMAQLRMFCTAGSSSGAASSSGVRRSARSFTRLAIKRAKLEMNNESNPRNGIKSNKYTKQIKIVIRKHSHIRWIQSNLHRHIKCR